ncbi:hypothetical protein D9758_012078 [Tetrapyrgos nigripes]|uniref:N-acetyltransferase domain-containing protein n=1 Tax=Tetrapyrgos nigripes TaxID=182062 RepID=A0A8H5FJ93_9AGAR|nr:hypothetical protein D9758_012078 [Tetrapyrgos nigripes]
MYTSSRSLLKASRRFEWLYSIVMAVYSGDPPLLLSLGLNQWPMPLFVGSSGASTVVCQAFILNRYCNLTTTRRKFVACAIGLVILITVGVEPGVQPSALSSVMLQLLVWRFRLRYSQSVDLYNVKIVDANLVASKAIFRLNIKLECSATIRTISSVVVYILRNGAGGTLLANWSRRRLGVQIIEKSPVFPYRPFPPLHRTMASEKSAQPLTTPRPGVSIRYCRPDDIQAIRKLPVLLPESLSQDGQNPTHCYSPTLFCSSAPSMLADAIYIGGSLHASVGAYINSAIATSFKSDLENPVAYYELVPAKIGDATSEYVPSGVKAFWIAEAVSASTGKTEIVGTISLDTSSSHKKVAGTGELCRMFVSPYHRRLGIGATLMDACEARARQFGLDTMVLNTTPNQRAAINMYERAGYKFYKSRDLPSGWGTMKLLDYGKDLSL